MAGNSRGTSVVMRYPAGWVRGDEVSCWMGRLQSRVDQRTGPAKGPLTAPRRVILAAPTRATWGRTLSHHRHLARHSLWRSRHSEKPRPGWPHRASLRGDRAELSGPAVVGEGAQKLGRGVDRPSRMVAVVLRSDPTGRVGFGRPPIRGARVASAGFDRCGERCEPRNRAY